MSCLNLVFSLNGVFPREEKEAASSKGCLRLSSICATILLCSSSSLKCCHHQRESKTARIFLPPIRNKVLRHCVGRELFFFCQCSLVVLNQSTMKKEAFYVLNTLCSCTNVAVVCFSLFQPKHDDSIWWFIVLIHFLRINKTIEHKYTGWNGWLYAYFTWAAVGCRGQDSSNKWRAEKVSCVIRWSLCRGLSVMWLWYGFAALFT